MKWFSNQKIKNKMIISFGLIILMMMTLSILSIKQISNVNHINNHIINYPQQRVVNVMQIQSYIRELRRGVTAIAMYTPQDNDSAIDSAYSDVNYAYERIIKYIDDYNENVKTDEKFTTSEVNVRLDRTKELKNTIDKYKHEIVDPMVPLSKKGDYDAVMELIYVAVPMISTTNTTLSELIDSANNAMIDEQQEANNSVNGTIILVIIIASIATLISIIVALYVAKLISNPINVLTTFMKKAGSTGDIALSQEDLSCIQQYGSMKDEIGQTISATASFIQHVTKVSNNLGSIADGDLTIEVEQISKDDVMGQALKNMTDNLNSMFLEINSSTSQVALGSQQIADGAQMLAQGSTEQAATVEELSAEISQIAQKTKQSAEIAKQASQLANEIKNNAEKGSHQMDEMIIAVNDINQASQSISKVIKVIDDIAFQTNILALNAAVEAARAGQHGKGFAVVADEVRNLAAKSAAAAKETSELITSSTQKAEAGAIIAKETSASLDEIVIGINQSSQIISEIANLAEEQSYSTEQINSGIDQVTQVVQQNSATAEESAAASEEMSSQAVMLSELIKRIKLKGSSKNEQIRRGFDNINKY